MADCQDLFQSFLAQIRLEAVKKDSLRTSRNGIRDRIRKHFKDTLKLTTPKFFGQGSYMMNTSVNPLDGEYDIDDGVYLQHVDTTKKQDDWPSPSTVHRWLVDATKGHTSTEPIDKNTCVRVIYQSQYHVDLPIYVMTSSSPMLAHKSKGWTESDPKAVTKWFRNEVKQHGDQVRNVARYLKAWKNYNESNTKLPSGLALTVLACNHFVADDQRDDASLVATTKAIHKALTTSFSVTTPAAPYDDLLADWSDTRRENFLSRLNSLVDKGGKSLEEEDKTKASETWIKLFGDRFPKYEPPTEGGATEMAKQTSAPAVLGNYGRSASTR